MWPNRPTSMTSHPINRCLKATPVVHLKVADRLVSEWGCNRAPQDSLSLSICLSVCLSLLQAWIHLSHKRDQSHCRLIIAHMIWPDPHTAWPSRWATVCGRLSCTVYSIVQGGHNAPTQDQRSADVDSQMFHTLADGFRVVESQPSSPVWSIYLLRPPWTISWRAVTVY